VSVTYPKGFRAAAVTAGFKPSGNPDLGLLVADPGTTVAGLFTTNAFAAAPVLLSRTRLTEVGGAARAVLVNSGQANAATGARGTADALAATAALASHLGLAPEEVLPCSTGVIGEPLHMEALIAALPGLVAALDEDGGEGFGRAIMTTDTVEKRATADTGPYRVGACAKGVGMISPHLATMLVFVTTDAAIASADLRELASMQLKPRFNALTVDGCPSTNDTVLLLASGAVGKEPVHVGSAGESLARQLIADGEGATHVLLVDVAGAATEQDARAVVNEIADSPLVKTAVYGEDPNPGRILQAVGSAGVAVDPGRVEVWIGDVRVVTAGVIEPAYFDGDLRDAARTAMKEPEVHVRVRLGDGPGAGRALGCDLSYEYVRINGEYTT
jgi:glutamate N-acetyltransferase/amino-acid N-acetyltransferase